MRLDGYTTYSRRYYATVEQTAGGHVTRSTTQTPHWRLVTIASDGHRPSLLGQHGTQVGVQLMHSHDVFVPDFLRGVPGVYDVVRRWDELARPLAVHDPAAGDAVEDPQ